MREEGHIRPGLLQVRYHRFEPSSSLLGNDRRWILFERVLGATQWDCAFAIDLTDVAVLLLPACHRLPRKLLAASDGLAVRGWFPTTALGV